MSQARSLGVPLPPNEGGAPPPYPVPPWPSSHLPSPPLRPALGGVLRRSWGFPPISWFRPRTKGVRTCSGGGPPSPSGWGPAPFSPLPPCTPCAWGARCSGGPLWLFVRVCPPPVCTFCALGVHAYRGMPPPLPPPPSSGGSPPPARACRALGVHAAWRKGPPLLLGSVRAP